MTGLSTLILFFKAVYKCSYLIESGMIIRKKYISFDFFGFVSYLPFESFPQTYFK